VVASQTAKDRQEAKLEREIAVEGGGWIAARVAGTTSTRLGYPVFAHTNPVYVIAAGPRRRQKESARTLADQIESGVGLIRKNNRTSPQITFLW